MPAVTVADTDVDTLAVGGGPRGVGDAEGRKPASLADSIGGAIAGVGGRPEVPRDSQTPYLRNIP